MARKIIGVLCLVMAVAGFFATATQQGVDAVASGIIAAIFGIVGLILILKKGKTKKQKAEQKSKNEMVKDEWSRTFPCEHITGLPLAQGSACTIVFNDDGISIDGGGNVFRVAFDRVTDLQIKSDVDIQKNYVSSVGGAVGGAVLFGPLGAIIGGRAKEKRTKTAEYYLIITYNKDGAVDYLSFHIFGNLKTGKLIQRYRPLLSGQKATIDL